MENRNSGTQRNSGSRANLVMAFRRAVTCFQSIGDGRAVGLCMLLSAHA